MPSDNKAAERFSAVMLNRAFLQNPVLVQALGLCPIAGGAVSLKAGLVLSAALTAGMMLNLLAAHYLLKRLPRWLRMPAYVLVALAAVCPAGYILETRAESLLSQVGIYLALLAVSSLISVRSEKTFVSCPLKRSFYVAAAESTGYSAVVIAVAFVRELAGSGTLWGRTVTSVYFAPGLLLPFGGFLALGFLAALHRGTVARHFVLRGALKDITFDLSAAAEPVIPPPAPVQPPLPTAEPEAPPEAVPETAAEPAPAREELPEGEPGGYGEPEQEAAAPDEPPECPDGPGGSGRGFKVKAWEPPGGDETETAALPAAETDNAALSEESDADGSAAAPEHAGREATDAAPEPGEGGETP